MSHVWIFLTFLKGVRRTQISCKLESFSSKKILHFGYTLLILWMHYKKGFYSISIIFFFHKTIDSIGEISRRLRYITLLFSLILTFNKMAMTKLSNTNLKGVGFILSLAIQSRICSLCMFLNKFIKAFGTQKKFRVDLSEKDSSSYFN